MRLLLSLYSTSGSNFFFFWFNMKTDDKNQFSITILISLEAEEVFSFLKLL